MSLICYSPVKVLFTNKKRQWKMLESVQLFWIFHGWIFTKLKLFRLQNFQGMTLSPERLFETKDSRMDQVKFVEGSLYKFERIWSASFMSDFPVIWQLGKSQEVQWMKTLNIYDLVEPFTFNHLDLHDCGSHQKCSLKNGVLSNFAKFTGKHLC